MKERQERWGREAKGLYGRGEGKRVRENEGESKERWGKEAKGLYGRGEGKRVRENEGETKERWGRGREKGKRK